jgi:hypothetical protein
MGSDQPSLVALAKRLVWRGGIRRWHERPPDRGFGLVVIADFDTAITLLPPDGQARRLLLDAPGAPIAIAESQGGADLG